MSRTANWSCLNPLGYDDPPAMVVHRAGAEVAKQVVPKVSTLSEAAEGKLPLEDRSELRISAAHGWHSRDQQLQASDGPGDSRHGGRVNCFRR